MPKLTILFTFRKHLHDLKSPSFFVFLRSCSIKKKQKKNSVRSLGVFSQLKQQLNHGSVCTFNIKRLHGVKRPAASTAFQILRSFLTGFSGHLGFSEEELQVSATQNAVVLHVAGNVHRAGAVHGAVHLHVVVDGVQVFLLILKRKQRLL